jgi:hypothetical protein
VRFSFGRARTRIAQCTITIDPLHAGNRSRYFGFRRDPFWDCFEGREIPDYPGSKRATGTNVGVGDPYRNSYRFNPFQVQGGGFIAPEAGVLLRELEKIQPYHNTFHNDAFSEKSIICTTLRMNCI